MTVEEIRREIRNHSELGDDVLAILSPKIVAEAPMAVFWATVPCYEQPDFDLMRIGIGVPVKARMCVTWITFSVEELKAAKRTGDYEDLVIGRSHGIVADLKRELSDSVGG